GSARTGARVRRRVDGAGPLDGARVADGRRLREAAGDAGGGRARPVPEVRDAAGETPLPPGLSGGKALPRRRRQAVTACQWGADSATGGSLFTVSFASRQSTAVDGSMNSLSGAESASAFSSTS